MRTKICANSIVLSISLFIIVSCNNNQNPLEKTFTKDELKEINLIIDFYDNYVLSKTDKNLPIEDAYTLFIENNRPTSSNKGNEDIFFINPNDRNIFLKSIDINLLLEIYDKRDSTIYIDVKTKEGHTIYPPFFLSIKYDGKFMDFLKDLSNNKPYYKGVIEEIESVGDVGPTTIARLLYNNDEIDFSSREERFVFAICFLKFDKDLNIYLNKE